MDFWTVIIKLFYGFLLNIEIFAITLLAALPLGLLISFGSMSKVRIIRWITRGFVWIIRGTPLMLQILIIYLIPAKIWGPSAALGRETAVIIAFIINYAAYFSEIFRGGIQAIPKGQYEAGQVLGMTKTQVFFKVVLMQVVKRIVPPMGNEIITLVKDTSLSRIIACQEILFAGQELLSKGLIWPLFSTGIFFLAFNGILQAIFDFIERKLNYFKV